MTAKFYKRVTALVLSFALALSVVTVTGFARETDGFDEEAKAEISCIADVENAVRADADDDYELIGDAAASFLPEITDAFGDETAEFIVELEGEPLLESVPAALSVTEYLDSPSGESAAEELENEQISVMRYIENSDTLDAEIEYTYSVVLNGFAVSAPLSAAEELASIPGVKNVSVAKMYDYAESGTDFVALSGTAEHTSGGMIDSDRANAGGYTGRGTVTAILDTGANVRHEAFSSEPENARMTKEDVAEAVSGGELNASGSAEQLYVSSKIPFAYDYADRDTDVSDSEGHGTHVAGSAGADSDVLTGVAPDTQLVICKVFSDRSSGASSTWIYAALEDCVLLDVDTINMSLGSAGGFSTDNEADEVYNRVMEAGICLMAAAGNDYDATYSNNTGTDLPLVTEPDNGIVGSPSTYAAAVSVASVNEKETYSSYILASDGSHIRFTDSNSGEKNFVSALGGGTYEYIWVRGYGTAADFSLYDVEGKIALVARGGEVAFTEKESNAYSSGAVGLIVYDNVSESLINMSVNGLIPSIFISLEDGNALRSLDDKHISVSADYVEYSSDASSGYISDFSSLGVTPDLKLKPEITAPGGNVYSTLTDGSYGNMSGTSMASPHMAGAASVIRQYLNEEHPQITSKSEQTTLINTLLMNTALPLCDADGVTYSPRKQGAGLAQVYDAVSTPAYVTVSGSTRPKADLGDSPNGYFSKTVTLTLHNYGTETVNYNLSSVNLSTKAETVTVSGKSYECISDTAKVLTDDEFMVTFSQDTVTAGPGESVEITVKLRLMSAGEKALSAFTNGTYLEGYIVLESADDGGISLSVPYLGFYGDWGASPIFDRSEYDDEEASVFAGSVAILDPYLTGYGLYLGANLFDESIPMDKDKIAWATRSYYGRNYLYRLFSLTGLLRAPEELSYRIASKDDRTVYLDYTAGHVMKSYYYGGGGYIYYDLGPTDYMYMYGWDPVYTDSDGGTAWVPDGDYEFTLRGRVSGTDTYQSVTYPVSIDNEEPYLVSKVYEEIDGTPYLTVTVSDNNYVMGFQLVSVDGNRAYSSIVTLNEDERGTETSVTFDLTGLQEAGYQTAVIQMYDYALNFYESKVISLVSENVQPTAIHMNISEVTMGAGTEKLQAYFDPVGTEDTDLVWTVSDEHIGTVEGIDETAVDASGYTLYQGIFTTTGKRSGWVTVTATTVNGLSASARIYVGISGAPECADLDALIAKALGLDEADYTADSWSGSGVEEALEAAIAAADDLESSQEQLEAAKEALEEGINMLEESGAGGGGQEPEPGEPDPGEPDVPGGTGSGDEHPDDAKDLPSDWNITEDGYYIIPTGTNREITVSGQAQHVTIAAETPDNTYGTSLRFTSSISGLELTLKNMNMTVSSYSAITFTGTGNILTLSGSSSIKTSNDYCSKALINVTEGTELTISGSGSLDLEMRGYAAAIGSNTSKNAGKITIDGGTLNITNYSGGAGIGGSSNYGMEKFTMNGGTVNVDLVFFRSGYVNNLSTSGAGIGAGNYDTHMAVDIEINGGVINGSTGVDAAVIGIPTGSTVTGSRITVNGGKLNLESKDCSNYEGTTATVKEGGACIGTASGCSGVTIQINGGAISAASHSHAPAIGSGVDNTAVGTVFIDGGTVTASCDNTDTYDTQQWGVCGTPAIGSGAYTTPGNVWINGGSVKASAVSTDPLVTGSSNHAVNDNLAYVYPVSIYAPSVTCVMVDGTDWKVSDNHPDDDYVYIWLPSRDSSYTIASDDESGVRTLHEVYVNNKGNYTDKGFYRVTYELTNMTTDGPAIVYTGADLTGTLKAETGYVLPAAISVTSAGTGVSFDYSALSGEFRVPASQIRGDVTVTASAKIYTDKSDLAKLIEQAEGLDEDKYTSGSWSSLVKALEAAGKVYEDEEASQDEIDDAYRLLLQALNGLEARSDMTELEKLIAEAETRTENEYMSYGWEEFLAALAHAKEIASDPDAGEEEITQVYETLKNAMEALTLCTDKSDLRYLIDIADGLFKSHFDEDVWDESGIEQALKDAIDVYTNRDAAQQEVDASYDVLLGALKKLGSGVLSADKTELEAEIAIVGKLFEDHDSSEYTKDTWEALKQAYDNAVGVDCREDASQAEVDEAYAALVDALGNLKLSVDKSALAELISEAGELKEEDYSDGWENFSLALENAIAVMEDDDALLADIDRVAEDLKNAMNNLVKKEESAHEDEEQQGSEPSGDEKPDGRGDTDTEGGSLGEGDVPEGSGSLGEGDAPEGSGSSEGSDVPESSGAGGDSRSAGGSSSAESVKTGDRMDIPLMLLVMFCAAAGIAGIAVTGKRSGKK